ncbi:MAG TPA: hypothetical protein VFZ00_31055 [Solirubrobacter sp.]|nr:hypothetical protein [Solirubrobacter sp.]
MEVVLLVVAVIGIALLVVPRFKRSRSKPRRTRRSMPSVKARRRAAVAAAAPVSTWSPGSGSDDDWDDDLGWEGVDEPAPETREAWERWRETESPLAAGAKPAQEPAELPSVERWRAAASSSSDDEEWVEDDGLGWEGDDSRNEPRVWVADPVAPASAKREVAVEPAPADGREWAAPNGNGKAAAAPVASPASRRFKLHPVLMVALYAAAGIGLVVLASTALLGGSSSSAPEPASSSAAPKAQPTSAPQVSGSLADDEFDVEVEPDDNATAAARKARRAFQRERARALAAERKAVAAKAAQARRKARAERRRKQQQQAQRQAPVGSGGGGATTTPQAPTSTGGGGGGYTPPTYTRPAPRRTCEFCIG